MRANGPIQAFLTHGNGRKECRTSPEFTEAADMRAPGVHLHTLRAPVSLINQVGLSFSELKEIYVAGAFGRHINPESAVTLGMLPDLNVSVYRTIGNSSLAGAEKVLVDNSARDDCMKIVQTITYLELNVNQEFMIQFSGSKFIPHTDPTLFPSVPFFNHEG